MEFGSACAVPQGKFKGELIYSIRPLAAAVNRDARHAQRGCFDRRQDLLANFVGRPTLQEGDRLVRVDLVHQLSPHMLMRAAERMAGFVPHDAMVFGFVRLDRVNASRFIVASPAGMERMSVPR